MAGYVQGARAPRGPYAPDLARQTFALGLSVTSGFRCSGSYHGCGPGSGLGDALDWGDSVNRLSRVWAVLWPHRARLAELLGPWGLYRYGRRFYHARLQAQHRDHVHAAALQAVRLVRPGPRTLRAGATGDTVRRCQRLLRARGFKSVPGPGQRGHGYLGRSTRSAVRRLQRAHDLPADAVVGPRTWDVLLDRR